MGRGIPSDRWLLQRLAVVEDRGVWTERRRRVRGLGPAGRDLGEQRLFCLLGICGILSAQFRTTELSRTAPRQVFLCVCLKQGKSAARQPDSQIPFKNERETLLEPCDPRQSLEKLKEKSRRVGMLWRPGSRLMLTESSGPAGGTRSTLWGGRAWRRGWRG